MNNEDVNDCAHEVDVIVHIDEQLDKNRRTHIEDVVERKNGVMRARFNTRRHHLMIVAYDPKRINSSMVLNYIRHQEVNAQLVGGI